MDKLVTVLICNHNYGQWVKSCINSVLASDYDHDKINICFVDDCSTDNSVDEIMSMFKEESEYEYDKSTVRTGTISGIRSFIITNSENSGPSTARNIGIDRTLHVSDYYLILDADDEILPHKITRLVEEVSRAPNLIGAVYADYLMYNVDTGLTFVEYKQSFNPLKLIKECIVHSGSLVNKNALLAVKDQFGFFDVNMRCCEDYDLWIRISDIWSIVHVPEVLSLVRTHNQNSTNTVKQEVWQQNWARINQKLSGNNG